LKLGKLPSK